MGNKNNNLFKKVRELKLPPGEYVLFGSAPLAVRRLRNCQDIDIIATDDLWNEYKEKGWETRIAASGSQYLWRDNIELYKEWKPGEWNIKALIVEADIIDELPFVKLERVLEWKKLSKREKDLKDIEMVEEFLKK
ncbi:MAG TPA: hypothetical protein PK619_03640 [bacterium]|nr:hypothetical protein [bacterium]HPN81382.1 hypothetical protein [bacterium]HPW39770.1 hypothetical protein [bacterium]